MRRKGVLYDVGYMSGVNWRPDYTPALVHRELEIIKTDLHCNAVKIRGRDTDRLAAAAEDALRQGLEVWFCPELWNKSPDTTLRYISRALAVRKLHAARGASGRHRLMQATVSQLATPLATYRVEPWAGSTLP